MPVGTVIFYQTRAGCYGKLILTVYGYSLTLRWVTYRNS